MFLYVEMSRYDFLAVDPSLRATLTRRNLDELKRLVAQLPGVNLKASRKDEVIGVLERFLLGGGGAQLWKDSPKGSPALLRWSKTRRSSPTSTPRM